jgi:surface antigen
MRKRLTTVVLAVALAGASFASSVQAAPERLQCAEFARLFSGIQIFGDAATWWRQAMGKYARGFTPETGSVLVFKASGIMAKGHVAVVSHVLTDRIIQVTHANWSVIDGHRGQVEKDVTVVDVSPTGDWSQVKVWYDPSHNLGNTIYPTYGFVYRAAQQAANVASRIAAATTGSKASAGVATTSLGQADPN